MPKYRECSVDEFLSRREMTTRDGIAYRAAAMPKTFSPEERSAVIVMTDETRDSYGDIVKAGGADLYRFEKNPIALFNHRSDLPIGTWSDVQKKPQRIEGKVTVAKEGSAPVSDMVFNMMSQGILRAASIGFMPTKLEVELDDDGNPTWCYIIHEWEMYECSIVSIPANPSALARSAGDSDELRIARDYIEQVLDSFVKTPEGLLVPRAEFEKAYRVVVEKIAVDVTEPVAPKVLLSTEQIEEFVKDLDPAATISRGEEHESMVMFDALVDGKRVKGHKHTFSRVLPGERPTDDDIAATVKAIQSKVAALATAPDTAPELTDEIIEAFVWDAALGSVVHLYIDADTPTIAMDGKELHLPLDMTIEKAREAYQRVVDAVEAKTLPENKTETNTAPIVVELQADTSQIEAAVTKVEGLFGRLAKQFPMFFPKAIEERIEPTLADPEPPAPPTEDEIAAARAKAAAVRERLVSKDLIAA